MRTALFVVAMLVLGLGSLVGLAAVVQVRERQPVKVEVRTEGLPPVEAATEGLAATVDEARVALEQGARSRAVVALDGALRASEVVEHAVPEASDAPFAEVHERVRQARTELQDGRSRRAQERLAQAAVTVRSEPALAGVRAPPPPPEVFVRYRGARLVDARGSELGEVVALRTGPEGDVADLAIGGARDVFGFLDLSARERRTVPVDQLLFGEPSGLGPRLVMLPWAGRGPLPVASAR